MKSSEGAHRRLGTAPPAQGAWSIGGLCSTKAVPYIHLEALPIVNHCQSARARCDRPQSKWPNCQESGAPCKTRTCDLLVRSQTLYPTELRARGRAGAPWPESKILTYRTAPGASPLPQEACDDAAARVAQHLTTILPAGSSRTANFKVYNFSRVATRAQG